MAAPSKSSWRRRVAKGAVAPDINVTPLVDVVLVLLIIFMVVTPALQQDVPLDLPGIFNPDPQSENAADPIKVSVARAGEFHLDGERYDLDGVTGALIDLHTADPLRRLVIRADQRLPYGEVRGLLARAQEMGFEGLNFLVGEKHREGEESVPAADAAAGDAAPAGEPAPDAPGGAAAEG